MPHHRRWLINPWLGCGLIVLAGGCSRAAPPPPTPSDVLVVVTATAGPDVMPTVTAGVSQTYRVQEGDTLSGIAARFGVSEEAILQANGLEDPNRVMAGQLLTIPPPEP
jgi:LysM repeat protein